MGRGRFGRRQVSVSVSWAGIHGRASPSHLDACQVTVLACNVQRGHAALTVLLMACCYERLHGQVIACCRCLMDRFERDAR